MENQVAKLKENVRGSKVAKVITDAAMKEGAEVKSAQKKYKKTNHLYKLL